MVMQYAADCKRMRASMRTVSIRNIDLIVFSETPRATLAFWQTPFSEAAGKADASNRAVISVALCSLITRLGLGNLYILQVSEDGAGLSTSHETFEPKSIFNNLLRITQPFFVL